ncbi:MAG TPA: FAD-dependent oxidoreductase, partial [Candidatus Dormibacteraeota bacterium]|nr:FAD-dependent oxidoreductase [Candidatus Dormibacteraeota bacterium]
MSAPLFTAYTELPRRLPHGVWRPMRWAGVAVGLAIAIAGFVRPTDALTAFWFVFVPIAPLLFLVAPGLWRNTCPMVSLNQVPRTLGFTRGLTLPPRLARVTPLISAGLFLAIVPLRKVWLDGNGTALGLMLLVLLTIPFLGGFVFKGKSGWCSQFCPMLSVERFYNLAPLVVVANSHCRPCVGCTKNCYDFNPTAAHLADLDDEDARWSGYRTAFAGLLPWLIVGFNTTNAVAAASPGDVAGVYGRLLLLAAAGIGTFHVLEAVTPFTRFQLVLLHVVAAINLFYWYVAPKVLTHFDVSSDLAPHLVQAAVAVVSIVWLVRAWPREAAFATSDSAPRSRASSAVLRAAGQAGGEMEVAFHNGPTVLARQGDTLLTVAEQNGVRIEAGCRMGMCGADPVRILRGLENLSPSTGTERATLQRVGAGDGCRMACVARPTGPVTLSLDLGASVSAAGGEAAASAAPAVEVDPTVRRVVVIGTGAAGITTVTELRKLSPSVELAIVGSEPYDFYNRMNIGKLVSEQTAIDKLYMLPRDWAEQRSIRLLRGVTAVRIDRHERTVALDTGERLAYDRVVVATGGRGNIPRIDGFGMPGTFVLRTLDDGVTIQQYVRRNRCTSAVVIGGGLLGLEAAYAMSYLGVRSYVLDRNPYPLSRQLDRPAGALLWQLMKDLGIEVVPDTSARRLLEGAEGRLARVELTDGRILDVGIGLAAAGVTPDVVLAADAGLVTDRGIVVDDRLATSDPDILAVGDCIEHRGRTYGLWPACVDHARIAAINAMGGDLRYYGDVPSCKLKVAGVDLLSAGETRARGDGDEEIRFEEAGVRRYRKLVICDGEVRGGMIIGHPDLIEPVSTAVGERLRAEPILEALRAGDWSGL